MNNEVLCTFVLKTKFELWKPWFEVIKLRFEFPTQSNELLLLLHTDTPTIAACFELKKRIKTDLCINKVPFKTSVNSTDEKHNVCVSEI